MKYAILSDIHGNLEALTVVLEKCRAVKVDAYICLGDIVGYNANPKECLNIVRRLPLAGVVKGNHDEYASNNDEVMAGFNPHAKAAVLWTKNNLCPEDRAWLAALQFRQTVRGAMITIVHATLDSPEEWGYIFDEHQAKDNMNYQFTPLGFIGHSHVPVGFCKKPVTSDTGRSVEMIEAWEDRDVSPSRFTQADEIVINVEPGHKYLLNVGSVGQPRNRDPRSSFAVYDSELKIVKRYRIPYDIGTAQAKIRAAGLPERLASRLEKGI